MLLRRKRGLAGKRMEDGMRIVGYMPTTQASVSRATAQVALLYGKFLNYDPVTLLQCSILFSPDDQASEIEWRRIFQWWGQKPHGHRSAGLRVTLDTDYTFTAA